jgi:hypothetical protein
VNLNPPVWTVIISPLGFLEVLSAYRVFVVISLVATVGYLAWTAEEVRIEPAWAVVGTVLLLLSSPMLATLALGQVYLYCLRAGGGLDGGPAGETGGLGRRFGYGRGPETFAPSGAVVAARAAAVEGVWCRTRRGGGGDARGGDRGWTRGDLALPRDPEGRSGQPLLGQRLAARGRGPTVYR